MSSSQERSVVDAIVDRIAGYNDREAFAVHGRTYTYAQVAARTEAVREQLASSGVGSGTRVGVIGDFGLTTTALMLALLQLRGVFLPITREASKGMERLQRIADPELVVRVDDDDADEFVLERPERTTQPEAPLYAELRRLDAPGLLLFTSGSSGEPKAVVHDFGRLLRKFVEPGRSLRTVNFLLFDHWGGLNTLLHVLSSGGFLAFPETRTPDHVCDLIERHRLELLPTSPSFLNMLLLTGAARRHDLSSLRLITYGAEPMPEATLRRAATEFPQVELRQTYGLIELGVLRAKSLSRDSLLVKLGGEGYQLRVVDGLLEIKAESSMLGYLNAPSPFTEDGYFKTGDRVEEHGEYLRILGRASELINVGGEKVFPAEVESVLLEHPDVADAVVLGESHLLSGQIVTAEVVKGSDLPDGDLRKALRAYCAERLERYKVPVRITFVDALVVSERQKKSRLREPQQQSNATP